MKLEEEAWRHVKATVFCGDKSQNSINSWVTEILHHTGGPALREERARLASAAPDLARVLLAVEWAGSDEEGSKCPSCHAPAFIPPIRRDEEGKYLGFSPGKHKPTCALDAAIVKAGLR